MAAFFPEIFQLWIELQSAFSRPLGSLFFAVSFKDESVEKKRLGAVGLMFQHIFNLQFRAAVVLLVPTIGGARQKPFRFCAAGGRFFCGSRGKGQKEG